MARQKLEKAGSDGSQHRPVCQAIVRFRSCAKNGFRTNGKPPPLASRPDSMITLNCPRICVALSASWYPSMPGMLMSVIRISIRRSPESFSKASFPLAAVITSHPRSSSMDAVTSPTSVSSSTTRTTRDKWQLPKQHLAIIQRLGVLGCSRRSCPSRSVRASSHTCAGGACFTSSL
jgi:hypothetical protein